MCEPCGCAGAGRRPGAQRSGAAPRSSAVRAALRTLCPLCSQREAAASVPPPVNPHSHCAHRLVKGNAHPARPRSGRPAVRPAAAPHRRSARVAGPALPAATWRARPFAYVTAPMPRRGERGGDTASSPRPRAETPLPSTACGPAAPPELYTVVPRLSAARGEGARSRPKVCAVIYFPPPAEPPARTHFYFPSRSAPGSWRPPAAPARCAGRYPSPARC